jgi:hypothetical protein
VQNLDRVTLEAVTDSDGLLPQNVDGNVDLYPQLPAEGRWGQEPGSILVVDYRPAWPWVVSAVAINLNNALSFLFYIPAGLAGRGELVRPVLIYMFAVAVLHDSASAVYFAAVGRARDAAASALVVGKQPPDTVVAFFW